jgi:hypothetical protein
VAGIPGQAAFLFWGSTVARVSRDKWFERIGHKPRVGQKALYDAWDAGHRYLGFFEFPRGGKSYGTARLVEPELLNPDVHCWIVAPKYELGSKEFGYMWQDFAEAGFLKMAKRKYFDVRSGNMSIEFPWDSWVRVLSAENPDSLRAEELDILILAEGSALSADVFHRYLFARVEKRKGRVLAPTTPKGMNWLYHGFRVPSLHTINGRPNELYDPAFWSVVVSADPDLGDLYEPGVYDAEYIARAKRLLPRPIYLEQVGGDFASYAGLIYEFDPNLHTCDPFPIPEEWPTIVGWDHGADNPTAILIGSIAPDWTHYWWGEIYRSGLSASEYAILLRHTLGIRKPIAISVDPSAKQVRIELLRIGVTTQIPHDKNVDARIVRTTSLMREGKWKIVKGRCPNMQQEIGGWEWDEDHPGRPRPHQKCHALDAMGYAVLSNVSLPEAEVKDPDVLVGETLQQERLWKGYRRRVREQEEKKEGEKMWAELGDDNPFAEVGVVQDYEPGF